MTFTLFLVLTPCSTFNNIVQLCAEVLCTLVLYSSPEPTPVLPKTPAGLVLHLRHSSYQNWLQHGPGLHQLLVICKRFHQSHLPQQLVPLLSMECPLVPLLQGSLHPPPSHKSGQQHTKPPQPLHTGNRPSSPIHSTAEQELCLG